MSRNELGELVRGLKDQLEWQSGGFASKTHVPKASDLDRETFEANVRLRRERAVAQTKASFSSEPEVSVPSTPSAPQAAVQQTPKAKSDVPSLWKTTGSRPSTTFQQAKPPSLEVPWDFEDTKKVKLEKLQNFVGDCQRCGLCEGRKNIVFGSGNPDARLMFIGEAPGYDEDLEGKSLVGESGQLLEKMIGAMGLKRSDVYLANLIKCRPPNNRTPERSELAKCGPFLKLQIKAIEPEVIVSLGKYASNILTRTDVALSSIRGQWQAYEGIDLMPTFHPTDLLRTPSGKRDAWQDLQEVMKKLGLS